MDLNAVWDRDAECNSLRYPHMRSPECRGTIPAGERHHTRQGESIEVKPDDWDDPRNRPRTCANCVSHYNWEYHYKDRDITTRVVIEYSDGSAQILEDNDADEWSSIVASQGVLTWTHGMACQPLAWRELTAAEYAEWKENKR